MAPGPSGPRSWHWAVKALVVLGTGLALSPLWGALLFFVATSAGGSAAFVLFLAMAGGAVWFIASGPGGAPAAPNAPARGLLGGVYCLECGRHFPNNLSACPECGHARAPEAEAPSVARTAAFLNQLIQEYEAGRIDLATFARVRNWHEHGLGRLRSGQGEMRPSAPEETEAPESVPLAPPPRVFEPAGPDPALAIIVDPATMPQAAEPPGAPSALPSAPVVAPAIETAPESVTLPPPEEAAGPIVRPEPTRAPAWERGGPPAQGAAHAGTIIAPTESMPASATAEPEFADAEAPEPEPAIPEPPREHRDLRKVALGWAAERQADILLYVGAFLLSVAAVVFVGYQGEGIGGGVRFAVLTAYAVAFLGGGLGLHRWERVKEAGPVFLGLGAILVPIDFVALRFLVFSRDQAPTDLLLLIASISCAALYFGLAARGYGRLYALAGGPAALLAWGALGSVVNVPAAWFGPWFMVIGSAPYLIGASRWSRDPAAPWVLLGGLVLGAASLIWTQAAIPLVGGQRWALPVAYGLALATVLAGFRWQRWAPAFAAAPVLASATAAAAWWAAAGLAPEWLAPFVAGAGLGYLAVAHFDRPSRAPDWGNVAGLAFTLGAALAIVLVPREGADRGALPATIAVAFVGLSAAFGRWRWLAAGAALPAVGAALAGTTAWAAEDAALAWYGVFAGIAPLGYLALALFDRPDRREGWRWAMAATAALGPALAHIAIGTDPGGAPWALPLAYVPTTVVAAISIWRWRLTWPAAPGALPAVLAAQAATAAWASWELAPEWLAVFPVFAASGYLALAHIDRSLNRNYWGALAGATAAVALVAVHAFVLDPDGDHWALPSAYAVTTLSAALWTARWRFFWRLVPGSLPALATMAVGSAAWAGWDLAPEWLAVFPAAAAAGYLLLAHLDDSPYRPAWGALALIATAIAVPGVHLFILEEEGGERWPLPAVYGLTTLSAAIWTGRWRFFWRLGPGSLPVLLGMTAGTVAWAGWDLAPEWWAVIGAAAAAGYLLIAHLDEPQTARPWASATLAGSIGALVAAHLLAPETGAAHAALPITYWVACGSAAVAFLRWNWVEAGLALPALLAAVAATTVWAVSGLAPSWYGPFAAGAVLGYLVLARFDPRGRREIWWDSATVSALVALALGHGGVLWDDQIRGALPLTYAMVLGGSALSTAVWRFQWRTAPGATPALASLTVLTGLWAASGLEVVWYGVIVASASLGYVTLAWLDSPAWRDRWLMLGAAAGAIGIAGAHAAQPVDQRWALAPAYAPPLLAGALAVWRWRLGVRPAIAVLPPLAAGAGATACWAAFDMAPEWLTVWGAGVGASYVVPALIDARWSREWRNASMFVSAVAVAIAHVFATEPAYERWPLPLAHLVALAGVFVQGVHFRDRSLLIGPAAVSAAGASTLWAAGAGPEWWPYPALAASAALMATERWWRDRPDIAPFGWAYALLLGATATVAVLPAGYREPAHGLAAQAITAALWWVAAWRTRGTLTALLAQVTPTTRHQTMEATLLAQGSVAFAAGALASFNDLASIDGADRAWVFVALASAGWLLAALRFRGETGFWAFTPGALAVATLAGVLASASDGTATAVGGVATAGPLVAFFGTRRWTLAGIANSALFLTLWAFWRRQGLDLSYLPVGFAALALIEWAALITLRRYSGRQGEPEYIIYYLSWAPWLAATAVSGLLLGRRASDLTAGRPLVETEEWALGAVVLGLVGAAVAAEGLRLDRRWVWIPGSAVILAAGLMAIATQQPTNVQAYVAPAGLWLIFVSSTFRTTPEIVPRHLQAHEAVSVVGALALLLPPAEQSFEPGGAAFGLEILGIAIALLVTGLVFHLRWLVPVAVVALGVTSIRIVTGGLFTAPYWLLLGIAGTALIAFGFVLLLERERWDRFRVRVVNWWQTNQRPPPSSEAPS
ncbi:MAG: hypothetical protein ACKVVT_04475 [Dehalococcoidia bacterium]